MVLDWDDFGANYVISDMCQSHDCRKQLDALHYANPNFKATLFAIPSQMTPELLQWCEANKSWIELAVHGIKHTSNYEFEKLTYDQIADLFEDELISEILERYFVKGFKAPGWQISDAMYEWLYDNDYWVADQAYNNDRRPPLLPAYINDNGKFYAHIPKGEDLEGKVEHYQKPVEAWHGHTWNCCNNGIEETFEYVSSLVKAVGDAEGGFKFVSEILND